MWNIFICYKKYFYMKLINVTENFYIKFSRMINSTLRLINLLYEFQPYFSMNDIPTTNNDDNI